MYNLTGEEAALVCSALKDAWRELEDRDVSPLGLPATCLDEWIQRHDPDRKSHVDYAALEKKLIMLDESHSRAIANAVKRFWELPDLPTDERMRKAGLL